MRGPLPPPRGEEGELPNDQTTNNPNDSKKHEEFKMEDGDSDTDKYPHRTGHNAGYN